MHLLIGLGPIGGHIGEQLATPPAPRRRTDGDGSGFHAVPVRDWSQPLQAPASVDLDTIDWLAVSSVHVSVPSAEQVVSVFHSLLDATTQPLTVFVHTTLAPHDERDPVLGAGHLAHLRGAAGDGPAGRARRGDDRAAGRARHHR